MKLKSVIIFLAILFLVNGYALGATFNVSNTPELRTALNNAGSNQEHDTIILADGIYKTTDDGLGTFEFLTKKNQTLTLEGSDKNNVNLSGENENRVLKLSGLNSSCIVYLNNLTIQKGFISGENGGGISSNLEVYLENVKLYKNEVQRAGSSGGSGSAIWVDWETGVRGYINNSVISYNDNLSPESSHITAHSAVCGKINISNSRISNNLKGAIYVSDGNIYRNVEIVNNGGYAISSCGDSWYLYDSLLENNDNVAPSIYSSVINDGCVGSDHYSTINNTIIRNNSATEYIFRSTQGMTISNVIFFNNTLTEGNTDFVFRDNNQIINSLFIGSNNSVIFRNESTIINSIFMSLSEITAGDLNQFYNNYINETIISGSNFKSNNIYHEAALGFENQSNGNFRLTGSSDLINSGTTVVEGIIFPTTDMDENQRVSGATIDIGPYEFSSTRPTINSFTHTGVLKIGETISFATDATPSDGRTIQTYEIDFGDGVYQEVASSTQHIFNNPGAHDITVKVTDSENEYSTLSITLSISDLSLEEKLTAEFEKGKQQVIDNYTQFGFVTTSEKEKAVTDAEAAKHAVITQKDNTIAGLNTTIAAMYTQEQLDQAVTDAETAKDAVISKKDETIAGLNTTIASMFTQTQLDKAVTDAETAKDAVITKKDETIADLNTTIDSMFTQEQLDQAVLTEKEKWDQNGDGKYGLPEAIKALQVTSGTDQE